MQTKKLFKTLFNQKTCNGGNLFYTPQKWAPLITKLSMCNSGYHLTTNPFKWIDNANQVWEAEGKGKMLEQEDKVCFESVRILRELSSKELVLLRKELMPFDEKKFADSLGDIPTKKNVVAMLKRINEIEYFRPQEKPSEKKLSLKVKAILKAFKLDFSCSLEFHELNTPQDWTASCDASREASWDASWDASRAASRDASREASCDASREASWEASRAASWEVVSDLMKKKGYKKNPYALFLELWEMGLYPVGVLKDKKFHIYYVPKKKAKK